MSTEIEKVQEEIRYNTALRVLDIATDQHVSIENACQQAGVPPRTFYRYVQEGALTEHLQNNRQARRDVSSALATAALPDVIRHMIRLATGEVEQRGSNPVAAAKFLVEIAGVQRVPTSVRINRATFLPDQMRIDITVDDADYEIIDGDAKEID